MNGFGAGLRGISRALGFAFSNGLWWLFLVPLVLWLAFATGFVWLGQAVVHAAQEKLGEYITFDITPSAESGLQGIWNDAKSMLNTTSSLLLGLVLRLAFFFLFSLIGKYIVLVVLSPVMAYASEVAEEKLTGRSYPFRLGHFLRDVGRGILMALRNGLLELAINILVWSITFFLPPLALLSAPFLWLVSCWFYGFSMFDYVFERQRLGIRASSFAAREERGMVLANGICFNLLMKIPLVGITFAPLLASIGAVLAWHERAGQAMR